MLQRLREDGVILKGQGVREDFLEEGALHFGFLIKNFSWSCHTACGILVSQLGIKPSSLAMKAQSPNHRSIREFPSFKL